MTRAPRSAAASARWAQLAWPAVFITSVVVPSACGTGSTPAPQARTAEDAPPAAVSAVWPPAVPEADASATVVLLEAPRARRAVAHVISAFFDAVRRESIQDLERLLSDDATLSMGAGSSPEGVSKVWAARFKRLDYGYRGPYSPYRTDELGIYTADEQRQLRGVRHFDLTLDSAEMLAVVPTRDRTRQAGPRHFGRKLEFALAPTADGLRIRRIYEDFRLP